MDYFRFSYLFRTTVFFFPSVSFQDTIRIFLFLRIFAPMKIGNIDLGEKQ